MAKKKNTLEKIGFRYAWNGIAGALKKEHNLKVHLIAAIFVVLAGFGLKVSLTEWLFLIVAIMAVLVAELFNTAIEALGDVVSTNQDPNIGFAKDAAAGAVLITAIFSAITGLIIFSPKVVHLFF